MNKKQDAGFEKFVEEAVKEFTECGFSTFEEVDNYIRNLLHDSIADDLVESIVLRMGIPHTPKR